MDRPSPWPWILLAAGLLLLPGPAGRLLLDLLGGVTLLLLLLPLLAGGAAWIAWQSLKPRLRTCGACGLPSAGASVCPGCGASLGSEGGDASSGWSATSRRAEALDARDVTINVTAVDVDAATPPDQSSD